MLALSCFIITCHEHGLLSVRPELVEGLLMVRQAQHEQYQEITDLPIPIRNPRGKERAGTLRPYLGDIQTYLGLIRLRHRIPAENVLITVDTRGQATPVPKRSMCFLKNARRGRHIYIVQPVTVRCTPVLQLHACTRGIPFYP
jgi:hypothetical protein